LTLPYSEWHKQKDNFTQRQRIFHTRDALSTLSPLIEHASLLDLKPATVLPERIQADVKEISLWDAQYTLMREEVNMSDASDRALYDLRIERNTFAAKAALEWMQSKKPDVVLIPNGLILEMGIVFRVARYLNIDAVTYEFNDQREQIWIAQNSSIMQQDTDYLVDARCQLPITDSMFERVADLENARRGARVWGKSKRLWQYVSSQGAQETRKLLNLDVQKTRMALGIAGSEAGGLRRNFGTMTKPFHPGQVARNGVIAAKLAAKGFTADPDILEGRQGGKEVEELKNEAEPVTTQTGSAGLSKPL